VPRQYAPEPRTTAPNVRHKIIRSKVSDQFSTYLMSMQDRLVPGEVGASTDLPETRQSRLHEEAAVHFEAVPVHLRRQGDGPTSDIAPDRTLSSWGSSSSE
jgi:hypothetical protein